MTVDQTQTFLFQQVVVRKLFKLEEQYEQTKGYVRISLARKIKKLKKQIREFE